MRKGTAYANNLPIDVLTKVCNEIIMRPLIYKFHFDRK